MTRMKVSKLLVTVLVAQVLSLNVIGQTPMWLSISFLPCNHPSLDFELEIKTGFCSLYTTDVLRPDLDKRCADPIVYKYSERLNRQVVLGLVELAKSAQMTEGHNMKYPSEGMVVKVSMKYSNGQTELMEFNTAERASGQKEFLAVLFKNLEGGSDKRFIRRLNQLKRY